MERYLKKKQALFLQRALRDGYIPRDVARTPVLGDRNGSGTGVHLFFRLNSHDNDHDHVDKVSIGDSSQSKA